MVSTWMWSKVSVYFMQDISWYTRTLGRWITSGLFALGWIALSFWVEPLIPLGSPLWFVITFLCLGRAAYISRREWLSLLPPVLQKPIFKKSFFVVVVIGLTVVTWYGMRGALSDSVESNRPEFSIRDPRLVKLADETYTGIRIGFKNIGTLTASELQGIIVFVDQRFTRPETVLPISLGSEVPPQNRVWWSREDLRIGRNAEPIWIVTAIRYIGENKEYKQVFYLKWGGAEDGKAPSLISHVTIQERDFIAMKMGEILEPYSEDQEVRF